MSRVFGPGTFEIAVPLKPGPMGLAIGIGLGRFLSLKNHGRSHPSVGVGHRVCFAAEGRRPKRRTEAS